MLSKLAWLVFILRNALPDVFVFVLCIAILLTLTVRVRRFVDFDIFVDFHMFLEKRGIASGVSGDTDTTATATTTTIPNTYSCHSSTADWLGAAFTVAIAVA